MMEPFVSIIVPVYKVPEQYLRKCIESTMTQTLKKIEILLVDDGSPDQCGEICDEYAEKDKRIRVLHKKNGGLSSARNYGCKAAQGKWIMFVDGDDWIEPDMCQTMYSAGEEKQVQLVMCGIMKDYGNSLKGQQIINDIQDSMKLFEIPENTFSNMKARYSECHSRSIMSEQFVKDTEKNGFSIAAHRMTNKRTLVKEWSRFRWLSFKRLIRRYS